MSSAATEITDSPRDRRIDIIGDALWYVGTMYGAQALGIVGNIISRRYLGPANSGVLALVTIIANYATLTHFGLIDGGHKLIPYWIGKGDLRRAQDLARTMSSGTLVLAVAVAMLGAAGVLAFWRWLPVPLAIGLLVMAFRLPVAQQCTSYSVVVRAQKRFRLLSASQLGVAVLNLAVIVVLVRRNGLYGMFAALFLVSCLNLFLWQYLFSPRRFSSAVQLGFSPALSRPAVRELVVCGLPIVFYGLLFNVIQSIDSLLIGRFGTMSDLGYYNLGAMVCVAVWSAPNGFSAVMFPRLQERFARSGDRQLQGYTMLPTTLFAGTVVPILVGSAWTVLPFLIRVALPKFVPAIEPSRILLMGCFFLCLTQMPIQYLVTTNRYRRLIFIEVSVAVAAAAGDILALTMGFGIKGVALWTSGCFAAFFLSLMAIGLRELIGPEVLWPVLAKVALSFTYLWAVLYGIGRMQEGHVLQLYPELFRCAAAVAILIAGLAPLIVATSWWTGLLTVKSVKSIYWKVRRG
jgi:O-antigen/teichoic acid export membrane protein